MLTKNRKNTGEIRGTDKNLAPEPGAPQQWMDPGGFRSCFHHPAQGNRWSGGEPRIKEQTQEALSALHVCGELWRSCKSCAGRGEMKAINRFVGIHVYLIFVYSKHSFISCIKALKLSSVQKLSLGQVQIHQLPLRTFSMNFIYSLVYSSLFVSHGNGVVFG